MSITKAFFFCLITLIATSDLSAKSRRRLPNQAHHQIKAYDRNHERHQRKLSSKQQELLKHYNDKKELELEQQNSDAESESF